MSEVETWSRVSRLFDEALELPADARDAFVRAQAAGDDAVITEVLRLLDEAEVIGTTDNAWLTGAAQRPQKLLPPLAPGERCGGWEIGSLLGRGGMGEVYLVERADGLYRQRAALKVLSLDSAAAAVRFHTERRLLASLEHPGIARVLDGGNTADGRPFMVMEYVDGEPVTRHAERHALSLEARLELMLRACDAVAHAHAHLVIHRDIKPSNLLATADGTVKLLDFGIARLLSADGADATRTVSALTPAYASPEQLTGRPISTATDLYSLAVILYQLLTGEPPIGKPGNSLADIYKAVVSDDLPLASRRAATNPAAPVPAMRLAGDLDAILAKALRREPAARYPTVQAFADDLRAFLDQSPVAARSGTGGYVLRRFIRRHAWQSAAATALVISLLGGLIGVSYYARAAATERDAALQQMQSRFVTTSALIRLMEARRARVQGQALDAADLLDATPEFIDEAFADEPTVGAAIAYVIGELKRISGETQSAEPLLQQAVTLAERHATAPELAEAQLAYGGVLETLGKLDAAEVQLRAAHGYFSGAGAANRRSAVTAVDFLAFLHDSRGEYAQAIALRETALRDELAWAGKPTMLAARLLTNHAITYFYIPDYENALRYSREAYAIAESLGQADTLLGRAARRNIASFANSAGDLLYSESVLSVDAEEERSRFGRSEGLTITLRNLAETQAALGKFDASRANAEEALAIMIELRGHSAPETLEAVGFLMRVVEDSGAPEQALELFNHHVATSGTDAEAFAHIGLKQTRATLLALTGDPVSARQLLEQSWDSKSLDAVLDGHAREVWMRQTYAVLLAAEGDHDGAVRELNRSIELYRSQLRFASDHFAILRVQAEIAAIRHAAGAADAADALRDVARQFAARYGADQPRVALMEQRAAEWMSRGSL